MVSKYNLVNSSDILKAYTREYTVKDFKEYCLRQTEIVTLSKSLNLVIEEAVNKIASRMKRGGKLLFCGNGGSAAEAQHLAAELMGRFNYDRSPLPSLALTVDTSALTAISNDYGYEHVFSRQLNGIANANDTLVSLSASGNSTSVINAIRAAKEQNILTVTLLGGDGGEARGLSDIDVTIESTETYFIQELHLMIGHYICYQLEKKLCNRL